MAIDVVGRVGQNVAIASSTTLAVTVGVNGVALGHRLLVGFVSNTTSTDGTVTCADSKGNTYVNDEQDVGANRRTIAFSAPITTPLVSGDTITVTVPLAVTRLAMDVIEVSGIMGKDVSTHDTGASTAPNSGATAIRNSPVALAWGICGWTNNSAGGDVFTARADFAGTETTVEAFSASLGRYLATVYKIAPAPAGTNSAAGTIPTSQNWSMLVVAYGAITAALTGTATAGIAESDIVAGGKTIAITLSGDTWVPATP